MLFFSLIYLLKTFIPDAKNVSKELSLHPVHLTPDKEGNLPPSALIPFCSYQGENIGRELPELDNIAVCDKFQPTIFDGQLCYTLGSALLKGNLTKQGKSAGLFLLIDPRPYDLEQKEKKTGGIIEGGQNFKVYINTLAQYSTFGPGSYAMTALKKMTGTSSFKQLPEHQRNCLVHEREECQTDKYLDQVQQECKCMPWALQNHQVTMTYVENRKVPSRTSPTVA